MEPAGDANPDSGRSMSVFKLDVLSSQEVDRNPGHPIKGSENRICDRAGLEWNLQRSAECDRHNGIG